GIEHLDPLGAELAEVPVRHSRRAERLETRGLDPDVGRREIDVHPVLSGLRLVHSLQEEARAPAVSVAEHRVLRSGAGVLVAERGSPERRHAFEVGAVQDELDLHAVILAPGQRAQLRPLNCDHPDVRRARWITIGLVAALALSACGGDDSSAATIAPSSTTAATTAPTATAAPTTAAPTTVPTTTVPT